MTEEQKLTWSTPDNQQGTVIETTVSSADIPSEIQPGGVRLTWYGKLGSELFRLEIAPGACSDGMSDKAWAYTARVVIGSETRSGCAEPR